MQFNFNAWITSCCHTVLDDEHEENVITAGSIVTVTVAVKRRNLGVSCWVVMFATYKWIVVSFGRSCGRLWAVSLLLENPRGRKQKYWASLILEGRASKSRSQSRNFRTKERLLAVLSWGHLFTCSSLLTLSEMCRDMECTVKPVPLDRQANQRP